MQWKVSLIFTSVRFGRVSSRTQKTQYKPHQTSNGLQQMSKFWCSRKNNLKIIPKIHNKNICQNFCTGHRHFSSELATRGILGFISWMATHYNLADGFDREQYISKLFQQLIRDWIVTETKIQPFFHSCDRRLALCPFGIKAQTVSAWQVRERNWAFYQLGQCGKDLAITTDLVKQ